MLFLLVAIVFILVAGSALNKKDDRRYNQIIIKSGCPPHSWKPLPIVDESGKAVGESLYCDTCKRTLREIMR